MRSTLVGLVTLALASTSIAQVDYPGAIWRAANSGNFSVATRPTSTPILYVVIHITEGSYSGAISWFQNAASNVSAHYVIRSSDGEVTQMVREKDIAYHAGVWWYNQRTVGIEHEATSTNSAWYTQNLYRSSAALTRYLTTKYNIPRTRTFIIGHRETGAATSCPGDIWDWDFYMGLVQQGAAVVSVNAPDFMLPGADAPMTVVLQNLGEFSWSNVSGADYVELRTSPDGRVSPFAPPSGWITSSRVRSVPSLVAPNAQTTLSFNLRGPSSPGSFTERFQLWRQTTGYFGPIIEATINVGTIDKVIDNTSADFGVVGTWSTGNSAVGRFGADYRFFQTTPKTIAKAQWLLNAPADGLYDVYAMWPAGTNRTTAATFDVVGGRDRVVRVFNQQLNGGIWNRIGRIPLRQGRGIATVSGSSTQSGVVMADAVRLVGPL